jgi:CheY-like chemotaxis protein
LEEILALRKGHAGVASFNDTRRPSAVEFLFGASENREAAIPDPPEPVLLDLKLPRLDGHEVLKRIKNDPRTGRIPVIVPTAFSFPEERDVLTSSPP